jgi:hypothetical protein
MRERYEAIIGITDEFCHEHLNEEYADLSRKMAAALSRTRPSPLESGRTRSWAAGIVYALGRVNFLSDDSREPYMTMSELLTPQPSLGRYGANWTSCCWIRIGACQACWMRTRWRGSLRLTGCP